ncbi:hypothetical protein Ahy_A05g022677 [Arachis hypogaea]|uniref:Uncharacterized protein n=1 Tax=Arachis hypogaea TaxID=3818 RepID=A0A445D187_ARAHY|nr:hypothetical protein Ahy_A05g022677 [Arachis hypogaea]
MEFKKVPEMMLNSGKKMPIIGLRTATVLFHPMKNSLQFWLKPLEHFGTTAIYGTEEAIRKAVPKALEDSMSQNI